MLLEGEHLITHVTLTFLYTVSVLTAKCASNKQSVDNHILLSADVDI